MTPVATPAGFRLEKAGVAIEGRQLLAPLDIDFGPGRVHGLIGHNGSGKSTLLGLLSGQRPPDRGRVLLDEKPVAAWGARAFARKVAFLPQHVAATSGLTVRELVAFGRYPWHGPLGRLGAADHAAIDAAIAAVGVAPLTDRLVDTLSGGERQRAWIGMLVAQDTAFMLLDEPTAALDLAQQVEVLSLVRSLCRDKGLGIVVVLHDVNMAARFCDELTALKAGRVIARGTPDDLMNAETLEAIFGLRMTVLPHPVSGAPVGLPQ